MSEEKDKKQKSTKKGCHQKQTGGHSCRLEYKGTGPRGESPGTLLPRKKKE